MARSCAPMRNRNYLRVRGEYRKSYHMLMIWWELPPRARRIPCPYYKTNPARGTTSACAENTRHALGTATPTCELPPRARRIRSFHQFAELIPGTTSACAENTARSSTGDQ